MVVSETQRLQTLVGGGIQQYRNTVVLVWSHCPSFDVMVNVTCAHHQSLMCFQKLPIHSISLPLKALCHILHLSLDQSRGATCSDCLCMQRALSFLFCCKQAWTLRLFTLAKHHSVWRQVHTNTLQKKHLLFWQLHLSPELHLLTRNSSLWQPAMAIRHTWSIGIAEVATRAGKFA